MESRFALQCSIAFKTSYHTYTWLKHDFPYSTLRHVPLSYITYLVDSTNLLSLFRVLRNLSILLPFLLLPNSWMTHITCRREVKLNTPTLMTFINPSYSLHALKTSDLGHLHLNIPNISLYVSYNPFGEPCCLLHQILLYMVSYILSSVASC
jgi:hypothetical protein